MTKSPLLTETCRSRAVPPWLRSVQITLVLLLLLITGAGATAGDLKVYTTSTDTTKQCTVGDSSKT